MKTIGSLFTLAGETLSAIGRMIERPAFNDEAAEQFLGGRWESDGPDAADVLADFEERVEVFEPPLIPRSSTAATPPRLVDRREPPATPSVVEAPGTQSSECPGCSDFACPGPHPTPPGASSVSQPAAAAVPGEAVGAELRSLADEFPVEVGQSPVLALIVEREGIEHLMRDYPHPEDLGLDPQADRTPDLRPGKDDDPGAGTPRPSEHPFERGSSMTTVNDCRHCTVPTEGDACNFCKSYTPPAQTSPHTIVRLDSSTAWRDLAGELTDHQRAQIESTEAHYRELGLDGPQARRDLLAYTIEYVNGNRIDADHAHVRIPRFLRDSEERA